MTMPRFLRSLLPVALLALPIAACASSDDGGDPRGPGFTGGKADDAFEQGPMYLTGAFDGSKSIDMWVKTMTFARQLEKDTGKHLRWTYFINTAYYSTTVHGSDIGIAASANDAAIRWAMTQQAINEGHEIGNHTVRHKDGGKWTEAQWKTEIDEFHAATESHLFQPVLGSDGQPLFPRWAPSSSAVARGIGSSCSVAGDCSSNKCLAVTPTQSFCSASCTTDAQCGAGNVCAGVCMPKPQYPVLDETGAELFDASGNPNLANPLLKPYKIVGFRAPLLAHNANLFKVLTDRGYTYDTSKVMPPGPPARTVQDGKTFDKLYQFGLMRSPGAGAIPMDYNYYVNNVGGDRMKSDYRKAIVRHYETLGRVPFNIGHHFSLWKDGAYWAAMQDAFTFAAKGCPDEAGVKHCEAVKFVTFRELAAHLDGRAADEGSDIFNNPGVEEDDTDYVGESCEE